MPPRVVASAVEAERTMATIVRSELPNEMRAMAGQSVEPTKAAFDKFMQSAHEAVSAFILSEPERRNGGQQEGDDLRRTKCTVGFRSRPEDRSSQESS